MSLLPLRSSEGKYVFGDYTGGHFGGRCHGGGKSFLSAWPWKRLTFMNIWMLQLYSFPK